MTAGARIGANQWGAEGLSRERVAQGGAIHRRTLQADVQLTGDVIGATTETWQGEVEIPAGYLTRARRTIRWKALLLTNQTDGGNNWTLRARLGAEGTETGDATGTLLDTVVITTPAANGGVWLEGFLQVTALGTSGTFDSLTRAFDSDAAAETYSQLTAQAVDTDIARWLKITGEASAAAATLDATLHHLEVEVFAEAPEEQAQRSG